MSLLNHIMSIDSVTPEDVESLVTAVKERAASGNYNPLRMFIQFKATSKAIDEVLKGLQPLAIDEACQYRAEGDSHMMGFKFSVRSGYAQYSFDHDAEYKKLHEKLEARKSLMKAAAKIKKAVADEETGELIQPAKIKGYTADSLTIKFQ